MSTGCILNADNDVIQSDISQETIFMLSGKDYLVIECLDDRDFDSDIWYSFELVTQSKNIKLQFVINKYKKGLEKVNALMSISKIPVIDKPGEVVFPTYS